MNIFMTGLALLIVAAWLVAGVGLIVGPIRYLRTTDESLGIFEWGMALAAIGTGIGLLLLFGAVATGAITGAHADGCYYLHTHLIGKTLVQSYDPIACPQ